MAKRRKKDDGTVRVLFKGGMAAGGKRWQKELDLCYRLHMGTQLYVRTGEFEYTYLPEGEDQP